MIVLLSAAGPLLANCTGVGVRVAIVDSGVASGHPHIGSVGRGRALVGEDPDDIGDRLGHGTAVTAAIRERAPAADLLPVRVLDRQLATSARILAEAIEWAVSEGAQLINLSLGTTNDAHIPRFEAAIARAQEGGALVVSARMHEGTRWYPGALAGAVGVLADIDLARDTLAVDTESPEPALRASPFPRPIPGVPPQHNLWGVSFAVANATGILARALEAGAPAADAVSLLGWLQKRAIPAEGLSR